MAQGRRTQADALALLRQAAANELDAVGVAPASIPIAATQSWQGACSAYQLENYAALSTEFCPVATTWSGAGSACTGQEEWPQSQMEQLIVNM